ncbi:hypothetical protein [Streptomyces sp. NPDC048225]|uniref:hypothetical protein n=1 Tax=Streptomyces sp. NPDC048225 TaxID=3365518 RepID=UPI00372280D0
MSIRTRTRTRPGPSPARTALTALVVLTAVATAACSNAPESDEKPAPRNRPTTSRPAPEPPAPSAADGSDVNACADGDCEITVTEPVTIPFQGPADGSRATLSVTAVGPDEIEYEVKSGHNRSQGSASGPGQGCLTYLRANGSGNSCGPLDATRPSPQPDAVVIQATTATNGTALLHIVSP